MKLIKNLWSKLRQIFTKCDRCGCRGATTCRQNTRYHKDELNFVTLCEDCHEENAQYWQERWQEYYHNCL